MADKIFDKLDNLSIGLITSKTIKYILKNCLTLPIDYNFDRIFKNFALSDQININKYEFVN